ncbi:type VI secretion system protein ImpA [Massilia sp. MP_M2]|uniref:type VI secretion system protein TssA n=1 Tax=Massilia sp. MP_M2 TaxID=3071713 RepID=UPI00319E85A6
MNNMADPVDTLEHADVARVLAPLCTDGPCGPSARYDPVFTEIRLLREEDDPQLPMGQWERPLKRADWRAIEDRCLDMLALRSKDLQIAVWLVEAWMRRHGVDGLRQGLRMVDALLRAYWDELHPRIEAADPAQGDDGPDLDARLAPCEWLNESLSTSLRVHTVLVCVDAGKPTPVTLADWERMTIHEMAPQLPAGRSQAPADVALTRADVVDGVVQLQDELVWMAAALGDCQDALAAIVAFLRAQLGPLAPNLGKLAAAIESARRVLAQLHDSVVQALPDNDPEQETVTIAGDDADTVTLQREADGPDAIDQRSAGGPLWRNRTQAYATLAMLADYLAEVEPHSPTPFLIRRAVNWGQMSLPEIIAEIIREEGDVNRVFNVLGARQ